MQSRSWHDAPQEIVMGRTGSKPHFCSKASMTQLSLNNAFQDAVPDFCWVVLLGAHLHILCSSQGFHHPQPQPELLFHASLVFLPPGILPQNPSCFSDEKQRCLLHGAAILYLCHPGHCSVCLDSLPASFILTFAALQMLHRMEHGALPTSARFHWRWP